MTGYLVTTIYRGSLHVSPMRLFDNEVDAWKYAEEFSGESVRVYFISSDNPPKLLKRT